MNKILEWFQGNLADKTTWIGICGVITAFSSFTLTPAQIAAVAFLGATLFTVRDRHIVAAGKGIKGMCTPDRKPIKQQVENDETKDLTNIINDDRAL